MTPRVLSWWWMKRLKDVSSDISYHTTRADTILVIVQFILVFLQLYRVWPQISICLIGEEFCKVADRNGSIQLTKALTSQKNNFTGQLTKLMTYFWRWAFEKLNVLFTATGLQISSAWEMGCINEILKKIEKSIYTWQALKYRPIIGLFST